MTDDRTVAAVRALARASRSLERASGELTLAQYRVLAAVASGEERASHVAAWLAVGKPTISAAVDSLQGRGLLTRTESAEDQRATTLGLTAEGKALLDRAETGMVARLHLLAENTPDPDRLIDSLVWLGSALDTIRSQRAGAPKDERR